MHKTPVHVSSIESKLESWLAGKIVASHSHASHASHANTHTPHNLRANASRQAATPTTTDRGRRSGRAPIQRRRESPSRLPTRSTVSSRAHHRRPPGETSASRQRPRSATPIRPQWSTSPRKLSITHELMLSKPYLEMSGLGTHEDNLMHFRKLKEHRIKELESEIHAPEPQPSFMSPASKHIVRISWMNTMVSVFRALDSDGDGYINVKQCLRRLPSINLDGEMKDFVRDIFSKLPQSMTMIRFEEFLDAVKMKHHQETGRPGKLVVPGSNRHGRARVEEGTLSERQQMLPFSPSIPKSSERIVRRRRELSGSKHEELTKRLQRKRSQRAELALKEAEEKKAEKERENCTFTPRKFARMSSPSRLFERRREKKMESTEDMEVKRCTFQPSMPSQHTTRLFELGKKRMMEEQHRQLERQRRRPHSAIPRRPRYSSPARPKGWHPDDVEYGGGGFKF